MLIKNKELKKCIEKMKNETDLWPWYWYSYGEKCYGFSTVEAYPQNVEDPFPEFGTELIRDEDGDLFGENGTKMYIESEVACIEQQNGDTICSFIALAHANLVKGEEKK